MAQSSSDVRGGSGTGGGGGNAVWDDFKSRVMAATDLVELIGRTVALKKMGKDYKGLCPFHQEKTPSFTVNPERGFFYCYGCKKGGDAITFVKERDRVEFKDALKVLATDAGIPMPTGRGKQENTDAAVCLEAHSLAAMFFENQLKDPQRGQAARDYLQQRGITPETAAKFRIGLAPEGWDNLLRGPVGRKFTPEQLHMSGLVKRRDPEKGQGFYDTFRNRLMFPIRDPSGRVIAFGGRVMPGSQDPAKYLNSPETPTFSKSRTAYGLDLARQRIVETGTVVVVEGYTDVVMAHQFGATNVVSILGTAMTEQHVAILRRFASRIVLLFDPDTAGDLAVDRAVSLFLTQPVEIAIANLGEDLDPDEFLLKHGLGAWDKLIGSAPEALAYKWKHLARQFSADDGTNLTGQQKAVEAYLDLIAQAKASGPVDPIRWGLVVSQVAKLTGIPAEQLQRRLATTKAVGPAGRRPGANGTPAAGNGSMRAGNNGYSRESPAGPAPSRFEQPRRRGVLSARDRAERWVLGALLLEPSKWYRVQTLLAPDDFTDPGRRRLAEVYWNHQQDEGEPTFSEFLAMLGDDAKVGNGGQVGPENEPIAEQLSGDNGVGFGGTGAGLRELAIEVTDEVEATGNLPATLEAGLDQIRRDREAAGKQKLIATLRRSSEQNLGAEQEVDLLKRLQDQIRQGPKPGPAKS